MFENNGNIFFKWSCLNDFHFSSHYCKNLLSSKSLIYTFVVKKFPNTSTLEQFFITLEHADKNHHVVDTSTMPILWRSCVYLSSRSWQTCLTKIWVHVEGTLFLQHFIDNGKYFLGNLNGQLLKNPWNGFYLEKYNARDYNIFYW